MATVTITGPSIRDSVAGKDNRPWRVWAQTYQSDGDGGVITTRKSRPVYPVAGVFTVELEAGIVATLENPDGDTYLVTIPDIDSDLWDVIAAAVAFPPTTAAEFVDDAVQAYLDMHPLPQIVIYNGAWPDRPTTTSPCVFIGGTTAPTDAADGDIWISEDELVLTDWGSILNKPDTNMQLARTPDQIIVGAVTRDANGAATTAAVTWPDGTTGIYTADTVSTLFPGAVDAYHITYGTSRTYTQPAVTRDSSGAVITLPAIVVS